MANSRYYGTQHDQQDLYTLEDPNVAPIDDLFSPAEPRYQHRREALSSDEDDDPSYRYGHPEHKPRFDCMHQGCLDPLTRRPTKSFSREADLSKHVRDTHSVLEYINCPFKKCTRKGDNGFTRQSHLIEHQRQYHGQDIRKRGPFGSGEKRRSGRGERKELPLRTAYGNDPATSRATADAEASTIFGVQSSTGVFEVIGGQPSSRASSAHRKPDTDRFIFTPSAFPRQPQSQRLVRDWQEVSNFDQHNDDGGVGIMGNVEHLMRDVQLQQQPQSSNADIDRVEDSGYESYQQSSNPKAGVTSGQEDSLTVMTDCHDLGLTVQTTRGLISGVAAELFQRIASSASGMLADASVGRDVSALLKDFANILAGGARDKIKIDTSSFIRQQRR